jgi:serine/threonine protein kinase/DNA-binding beta-propeller fold protein YncE
VSDETLGGPGEFAEGSLVAGYRLEQQIGRGGMAVVFRAHDPRLDRLVALKIMAPGLSLDDAFRQRFIRESRAAAAVDDSHIIPVYEAGEENGVLFIAMRYVSGGDVRSLLDRDGPLPPGRAMEIISQVASALDAAHGRGLVHRDVKPANMLLEESVDADRPDHVYLSDFGLTKATLAVTGLTATGQFLGTLDYVAPEQIEGRPVDGRTDLYALACAAFELLTGAPPFARDQGMAVMYAQVSEPPPLLSSRRAGLPAAADAVMNRALAKAPADRYATCREFAAALRRVFGLHAGSGPRRPDTGGPPTQIAAPVRPTGTAGPSVPEPPPPGPGPSRSEPEPASGGPQPGLSRSEPEPASGGPQPGLSRSEPEPAWGGPQPGLSRSEPEPASGGPQPGLSPSEPEPASGGPQPGLSPSGREPAWGGPQPGLSRSEPEPASGGPQPGLSPSGREPAWGGPQPGLSRSEPEPASGGPQPGLSPSGREPAWGGPQPEPQPEPSRSFSEREPEPTPMSAGPPTQAAGLPVIPPVPADPVIPSTRPGLTDPSAGPPGATGAAGTWPGQARPWWRSPVAAVAAAIVVVAAAGGGYLLAGRGGGSGTGSGRDDAVKLVPVGQSVSCATTTQHASALTTAASQEARVHGGTPFAVQESRDGDYTFVTVNDGLAVLRNSSGAAPSFVRIISIPGPDKGLFPTEDGRYLLIANGDGAVVVDVAKAEQGAAKPVLGDLAGPALSQDGNGAVGVRASPDGKFVFVTLQNTTKMAVFNFSRALADNFGQAALVGYVPLGVQPVGISQSPDGSQLYVTSFQAAYGTGPLEGTLSVVNTDMAETSPATAVRSTVRAGCSPARIVTSSDGSTVWVTARDSNTLLGFSASKLISEPAKALVARVRVGPQPIGLTLARGGKLIVVADSNYSDDHHRGSLAVVDTAKAMNGQPALLGYVPAGGQPRQLTVAAGGATILVTNQITNQLQQITVAGLP